ncbi:leucine-rich repeat domain-containing protein [Flavobacterium subsaxonicum]|uniref:Leucine-rich repeat-containing protein n=1 Tax=Flavobacterium subsaxonicum WB 4.1-42 = DSM 21790 TaxID=1121898 RepID=A0A0A2MKS2_9FLAO|nr:leucine-rich repeat domain-containing protein [Flavobacterium subsaxonicum]KGO93222.1 hypothetical protein Q766_07910 [Flavobacterium subsaxonicum WB 4.1-42 = DSM 21790]
MGRFRELFFGEFNNLSRALLKPGRVKKLRLSFPDNLNDHGAEFLKFTKIRSLNIQTNIYHAPYLPKQIGQLKTLTKLSILNVPFEEFPEWIPGLTNLEYLMVRGCEITEIPPGIKNLQKIKVLRIENCEVTALPVQLAAIPNLKYLSLTDTRIKKLDVSSLPPNLETLGIIMTLINTDEKFRIKEHKPTLKFD